MAGTLDTKAQGPIKNFKYNLKLQLANGDFQDVIIPQAQESKMKDVVDQLAQFITPQSPVSQITIAIGNRKDTA